jgi:hypothetical protein
VLPNLALWDQGRRLRRRTVLVRLASGPSRDTARGPYGPCSVAAVPDGQCYTADVPLQAPFLHLLPAPVIDNQRGYSWLTDRLRVTCRVWGTRTLRDPSEVGPRGAVGGIRQVVVVLIERCELGTVGVSNLGPRRRVQTLL